MKLSMLTSILVFVAIHSFGQQPVSRTSLYLDAGQKLYEEYDENDNLIFSKSEMQMPEELVNTTLTVNYYNADNELVLNFSANSSINMIHFSDFVTVAKTSNRREFGSTLMIKGEGEKTVIDILTDAYKKGELYELINKYSSGNHGLIEEVDLDRSGRPDKIVSLNGSDTSIVETFAYFKNYSTSVQMHYLKGKVRWQNYSMYNENGDEVEFYQINNEGDTTYTSFYTYDDNGNLIREVSGSYEIQYSYIQHEPSMRYLCVKGLHIMAGEEYRLEIIEYDARGYKIKSKMTDFLSGHVEERIWRNEYFTD